MKRRIFIEKSGKIAALASVGLLAACSDEEDPQPDFSGESIEIDLSQAPFDALNQDGTWVLHPSENILLVNVAGSIRAFTSVCTHSACSRNWTFNGNEAQCTCHGSVFDNSGNVVNGPASSPLRSFDVNREGDSLTVSD